MIYRCLPLLAAWLALPAFAAAPPTCSEPLHQAIDRLLAFDKPHPCSDAEFVRRVYLDLTGCIPSVDQTRAFLTRSEPNKRQLLIDQLLASPEHARHLANFLDVTLMERLPDRVVPRAEWQAFLFQAASTNMPWDVLVGEVLSGDSSDPKSSHRVKFYLERGETHQITRDVSRLILGANLQCAQCHDHPRIEEYRQEDYYGLFAFLGRVSFVTDKTTKKLALSEKADGETTYQSVFDPRKVTKTALPRVPGGKPIPDAPVDKAKPYRVAPAADVPGVPTYSRRAALASAITRSDNAMFRRNIANRLWAKMMGRGLVEPVDMDYPGNPASYPELLDHLAQTMAEHRFDMRYFLREIALSQAYQRSSELPEGVDERKLPPYFVAVLKPLTPEQLAFSLMQATGLTEVTRQALGKNANEATLFARLEGNVRPFVRTFGSPAGMTPSFDARMDQALFLANGPMIRGWLTINNGLAARLSKLQGDALADELYLSVLTRLPNAEERKDVADFLTRTNRNVAELAWALLASTEFRFNH